MDRRGHENVNLQNLQEPTGSSGVETAHRRNPLWVEMAWLSARRLAQALARGFPKKSMPSAGKPKRTLEVAWLGPASQSGSFSQAGSPQKGHLSNPAACLPFRVRICVLQEQRSRGSFLGQIPIPAHSPEQGLLQSRGSHSTVERQMHIWGGCGQRMGALRYVKLFCPLRVLLGV